ncbi:hypothetical protein OIU77_006535 [Salix suchowensis]|uniref:Uncharacterized protein n=1 Tax=Salix suchowensis TaxID=1278906 RepID=A0ABQ9AN05_9ROSI|nr:hypothetical protein OIU77_006535 [Salix suchowensis]
MFLHYELGFVDPLRKYSGKEATFKFYNVMTTAKSHVIRKPCKLKSCGKKLKGRKREFCNYCKLFFRIVAAGSHTPRDGKHLQVGGFYDPLAESDARALRTVLSLTGLKEGLKGHIVVELSDLDNEPWESYKRDISIDVKKQPWISLPIGQSRSSNSFRDGIRAVPGVVGGMLLHCKSLRRFEQSGGIEIAYFLSRVASSMHIFWHICENSRSCSDWSRTSSVVNIRMMPSVDICTESRRSTINDVLEELFAEEGNELQIRQANLYLSEGEEMSFYEVLLRARQRREIVIGYRAANAERAVINPPAKTERRRWSLKDAFVVIAEKE